MFKALAIVLKMACVYVIGVPEVHTWYIECTSSTYDLYIKHMQVPYLCQIMVARD